MYTVNQWSEDTFCHYVNIYSGILLPKTFGKHFIGGGKRIMRFRDIFFNVIIIITAY